MKSFYEFMQHMDEQLILEGKKKKKDDDGDNDGGNWIKSAINPQHKGYCTPMTKKTCTPRRKALAKRFKKGGDLYAGKKKKKKED